MTAARVITWRHGETAWNAEGRYQGQADVPLNDRGLAQASAAADGTALAISADRYVRGLALLTYEIASLFSAQGRGRLTFAVREALPAQGAQAAEAGNPRTGADASGGNASPGAFALCSAFASPERAPACPVTPD